MKKQTIFNLSSMPKMVLIITLVVMIGTLFGATSYLLKTPKIDMPIVNPVVEDQVEEVIITTEKSALDARCGEKVKFDSPCHLSRIINGYEFDVTLNKCKEVEVYGGCNFETPFESLEECQEVCEEEVNNTSMVWKKFANSVWVSEDMTCEPRHYTCTNMCYEKSREEIWNLCKNEGYVDYTDTEVEVLCFGSACLPKIDILTKECHLRCPG